MALEVQARSPIPARVLPHAIGVDILDSPVVAGNADESRCPNPNVTDEMILETKVEESEGIFRNAKGSRFIC